MHRYVVRTVVVVRTDLRSGLSRTFSTISVHVFAFRVLAVHSVGRVETRAAAGPGGILYTAHGPLQGRQRRAGSLGLHVVFDGVVRRIGSVKEKSTYAPRQIHTTHTHTHMYTIKLTAVRKHLKRKKTKDYLTAYDNIDKTYVDQYNNDIERQKFFL